MRVAPGWTVVETIDNPMGYTRPGWRSVGLHVVRDGLEKFVMLAGTRNGFSTHANDAAGSLSDWLPTVVANQRALDGASGRPAGASAEPFRQVRMTADGDLAMPAGARVVGVRAAADLPPVLTSQGDKPIAAQVATADGRPLWVFARLVEGRPQVDEFATRHADLDAFVIWVAAQFESGGGVR
ncbi:hypothetical protein [Nocardioides piscis]|uniref:Uncharacterized protein n=1 Tax=Nocardioides piscis TaxID=2714938 RepID=A0A6G7YET2_9ACTN|nr:hypothetical protein [Nocardioides piscis]QIK75151.1 hypothetical protein G7071_06645 [Nocardioides piscis]